MEAPVTQSEMRFTRTALYRAIRHHDLAALHRSIRRQQIIARVDPTLPHPVPPSVAGRDEHTGFTYVHLVVVVADVECESRLVPFVYALSNAGVDLDAVDCRQRTAIELAITKRLASIMEALLRAGADQTRDGGDYYRRLINDQKPESHRRRLLETFDKFSPGLWTAVAQRDIGTVYILVNSWCRVKTKRRRRPLNDVTDDDDRDDVRGVYDEQETLVEYAINAGASRDLVRLLESYEMTIELVHATLAGDRDRMLELLMDERQCDVDIMDISHQDEPLTQTPDSAVDDRGRMSQLRPRSLRETAEAMSHLHVLDLLPEEPSTLRRKPRDQSNTPVAVNGNLSSTLPSLRLDLGRLATDDDEVDRGPSRTLPRYQSLRGQSRRSSATRISTNGIQSTRNVPATPTRTVKENGGDVVGPAASQNGNNYPSSPVPVSARSNSSVMSSMDWQSSGEAATPRGAESSRQSKTKKQSKTRKQRSSMCVVS